MFGIDVVALTYSIPTCTFILFTFCLFLFSWSMQQNFSVDSIVPLIAIETLLK